MKIKRVEKLAKEIFINEFLLTNIPVIITDAMNQWQLERFSPAYLGQKFGDKEVQIYNDQFDLQTIDTLNNYFKYNFNKAESAKGSTEYIRWYTKFKDVDFIWSDEVFASFKDAWGTPYFFPNNSFAVPFAGKEEKLEANRSNFPYKGLFISGKGARTRLHRDPLNSDAILCQLYGSKLIKLYHPDQANYLVKDNEFVDLQKPDMKKFPGFSLSEITYEDILSPGEIVIFPAGWFHDVTSINDSISITWNFIYSSKLDYLYSYLHQNPHDVQLEVIRYYLNGLIKQNAGSEEIADFFRNRFE